MAARMIDERGSSAPETVDAEFFSTVKRSYLQRETTKVVVKGVAALSDGIPFADQQTVPRSGFACTGVISLTHLLRQYLP